MDRDTIFLAGRPSFIDGFARVVDFAGALNVYSYSKTPEEADARAMASDFAVVGHDLRKAMDEQPVAQGA